MLIVHRDERFERCIEVLQRSGGEAEIAATRAELLIAELARSDEPNSLDQRWKTRNGEARIEGCRKFYIGHRYRMIGIKKGQQLVLLYAGTHDECDRWIEHNRRLVPELPLDREPHKYAVQEPCKAEASNEDPDSDYEELLRQRLNEHDLRRLFCGLCGG